jgi:hypothetical protein
MASEFTNIHSAISAQALFFFDGEFAVWLGTYVEKEVATFGAGLDQQADQLTSRFVVLVLRLVLP